MSRPSDGFDFDELRDEFDWMFEFNSRMAERIREDSNVHNLADYVAKLESENAELRKVAVSNYKDMLWSDNALEHIMAKKKLRELGMDV